MTSKTAAPPTATALEEPVLLAPVLTALVPDGAQLGGPNFTLHVIGDGFTPTHVILWNGAAENTTFVNARELTTGVNMATAEIAMPIPVSVQAAAGVVSNVLTFNLGEAPSLPELPDVPDGFVLAADAYNRPMLIRVEEIAGIEEATPANDRTGPLYGLRSEGQHIATSYRRITLRSGFQFYVAARALAPMLAGLGVSSTKRK